MNKPKTQRMEVLSTADRIRHHEFLLRMYRHANNYADLLSYAGNREVAESIREDCRTVAREHMLDRVLNPAKPV